LQELPLPDISHAPRAILCECVRALALVAQLLPEFMKLQQLAARLSVVALAALLASCAGSDGVRRKDTSRTFNTVVVDAGHGGKDAGARRYGAAEKVVALDVAQRVNRKLRESRFRTVMTRNSDVFIPLDRRVAIGNSQENSVFVSIHFNHARRRGIQGFETYYSSPYARSLAQRIQRKLLTMPGARNRGVRTANFRVVKYAVYPSVLVECGFLTNRAEAARAKSPAYREMLADKIAEAIVEERYGAGVYFARAAASPDAPAPGTAAPGSTQ
jgi:N-acetylmuramoyl-L-alanine amidase